MNHLEIILNVVCFGSVSRRFFSDAFVFEDYVLTNPTDFNRRLRSRIDYYNRIQPDLDGVSLSIFIFPHLSSPFSSIMMMPFKQIPFENYHRYHLNEVPIICTLPSNSRLPSINIRSSIPKISIKKSS